MTRTITVSYRYDIPSIEVDEATFTAIKAGKRIEIDGQGFMHEEDGLQQDHWVLGEARVVDDPSLDLALRCDRPQDEFSHLVENRFVRPSCLTDEMQ